MPDPNAPADPARRRPGGGFFWPVMAAVGIVAMALTRGTRRPRNGCLRCRAAWYPVGRDTSRECPRCGSRRVTAWPGAEAVGCVVAVLVPAGVLVALVRW